ncbi:hypothetical protein IQ259_13755 [Fortiea sp. LEGE XX443]|uniref:hypothetical protein n=1 Tax=Fortiea sp. LEGE XX443 TaxID=1828611 RepID=UPI001881CA24|nr:hypothetical protein [Fortiea sp. LEGE XX443]MBE9006087.1 hypothetical protein [Fortiea sp. LEGE XX443]
MSNRHYPPAYLRYFKARLWNLGKPAFWGTAIFLSVLGLVIREYWSNPNAFTQKQNNEITTQKTNDSSLTQEDKAIAADIDNLPVLYNEVEQATSPIIVSSPTNNSKPNKGKDFLQDLINKQKSAKDTKLNPSFGISSGTSVEKNPFVTQTENLLQFGTQNSSSQLFTSSSQPKNIVENSYAVGIGVNKTPNNPYNSISSSPTILPPSTNQTPSSINGVTSAPSNTFGQTLYNEVPQNLSNTNNNLGTNLYNQIPQSLPTNNQPFTPSTSLNGGTGYIQPTVPNLPTNSYNRINTVPLLPTQIPSTTTTQPITSTAPTNTTPNAGQNPYSNLVTPSTPASYQNNRYFRGLPIQIPQSNFSTTPQIPGQSTGGVPANGYGY